MMVMMVMMVTMVMRCKEVECSRQHHRHYHNHRHHDPHHRRLRYFLVLHITTVTRIITIITISYNNWYSCRMAEQLCPKAPRSASLTQPSLSQYHFGIGRRRGTPTGLRLFLVRPQLALDAAQHSMSDA